MFLDINSENISNFWLRPNIDKSNLFDNDIKPGTVHFILLGWPRELQKVYAAPLFCLF